MKSPLADAIVDEGTVMIEPAEGFERAMEATNKETGENPCKLQMTKNIISYAGEREKYTNISLSFNMVQTICALNLLRNVCMR